MDEEAQNEILEIARQNPELCKEIAVALSQIVHSSRRQLDVVEMALQGRRDELDMKAIKSFKVPWPVVWEDGDGNEVRGMVVGHNKRTVKVLSYEEIRRKEEAVKKGESPESVEYETENIFPKDLRSALKDTDEQDEAADEADDADDREESPEITAQQLTEE